MPEFKLRYNKIEISVNSHGAELTKFILGNVNYIHQKDIFWDRSAPHLFPFVGRLKNNEYIYNNQTYPMTGHGFLRDQEFSLVSESKNKLVFEFKSNIATYKIYPFYFIIRITYKIIKNGLSTKVKITNRSNDKMYFNYGEHPGFNLFSDITNYIVVFNKVESFKSPSVSNDKLLDFTNPNAIYNNAKEIKLDNNLFTNDAIININSRSKNVKLVSSDYILKYSYPNFKSFAIWTKPNANFICLEPWNGYADLVNSKKDIKNKEQVIILEQGKSKVLTTKFIILTPYGNKNKENFIKEKKQLIIITLLNLFLAVMFFLAALLWQKKIDIKASINALQVSSSILFFIGWMVLMANKNILSPFVYGIKSFLLMFKGSKPKDDYYTYTQRIKENPYPSFMFYIPMLIALPLFITSFIIWLIYELNSKGKLLELYQLLKLNFIV